MLRSCLLRTETLPTGVYHKTTDDRSPPEGDDAFVDPLNDQFILRPKEPPASTVVDYDGTLTTTSFPSRTHRRTSSYSSQFTIDGEQDDDTRSLHVLSDEQIDHLAFGYIVDTSERGTHDPRSTTHMSQSLLDSLSNPLSKLVVHQH